MATVIAILLAAAAGYLLYLKLTTGSIDGIFGGLDDHDKDAR